MKQVKPMLLGALLAAMPLISFAQEAAEVVEEEDDGSGLSWNAAVTSDYLFRGVSQNSEEIALQGGIDYAWSNGFYVGAWGSQVNFDAPGTPDTEIDLYAGYSWDVSDSVNLDFQLVRYEYLNEDESTYGDPAYNEFITTATFIEDVSLKVGYTNDVYASDSDSFYYAAGYSHTFESTGLGFALNAGRTTFEEDEIGLEDYTDWGAAVTFPLGVFSGSLGYYGNDGAGRDNFGSIADDRFVFTISYEH